jgi:hypothetical protein
MADESGLILARGFMPTSRGQPHQDITHALKATVFFATPYHAWERGLK